MVVRDVLGYSLQHASRLEDKGRQHHSTEVGSGP